MIAHTSGTSTEEAEAGGLPSVPGQYELQNEHLIKKRQGRKREEKQRWKEGGRESQDLKITETALTN